VNIHIDIQAGISMQGHFAIDVLGTLKSTNGYPYFNGYQPSIILAFIAIHLDIHLYLWTSMHGLSIDSRSRAEEHVTEP